MFVRGGVSFVSSLLPSHSLSYRNIYTPPQKNRAELYDCQPRGLQSKIQAAWKTRINVRRRCNRDNMKRKGGEWRKEQSFFCIRMKCQRYALLEACLWNREKQVSLLISRDREIVSRCEMISDCFVLNKILIPESLL